MTDDQVFHLDEAQVLVSLIDEADLPVAARSHLAACPACQAARRLHVDRLERLAELAREAAPAPSRRVTLPREWRASAGKPVYLDGSRRWKPALALATVALVVIVLGTLRWNPGQERRLTELDRELREDQAFITEVQRLETDGLPALYAAIAGDDDLDEDEDPWDWMVPGAEEDTLSDQGGPKQAGATIKSNGGWAATRLGRAWSRTGPFDSRSQG